MVEFDVSLTEQYAGREAIMQKMKTRLSVKSKEIPYTQYGLDYNLYTYLDPTSAIQIALGVSAGVQVSGGRVKVADVEIDMGDAL